MTSHLSTTCNIIDFKLRCVMHWQKCYFRADADKELKEMMLRQTERALSETKSLVNGDKELTTYANKKFKEYELKPISLKLKKEKENETN